MKKSTFSEEQITYALRQLEEENRKLKQLMAEVVYLQPADN